MWCRSAPSAGELWLFDAGARWGDEPRAHIHWRRRADDEVFISGLRMTGYCRAARTAILAELGRRYGFTRAAWHRMKNGRPIEVRTRIMAKNDVAAAESVDKKMWVEFGYIDDKGRRIVQRSEHDEVPHRITRGVQLAVVGALVKLPGDDLSGFIAALRD